MRYRIVHETRYRYDAPVSRCRNEAHLRPRDTVRQTCLDSDVTVDPAPASWSERTDFYGNSVVSFAVDGPFDELTITSSSSVRVEDGGALPDTDRTWEEARDLLASDLSHESLAAREFCFESPLVPLSPPLREYAGQSFTPRRPLVDTVTELTRRIFLDFTYDPGFTTVTTPVDEVLAFRRGVCQDFAHLAIGCFRSVGLAARYVSGYLETDPPEGEERRVGADATHAWPSVFVPGWGWLDMDPTNDRVVGPTYVTTAWGRDYADVTPLKGIVFGGGAGHALDVSVDVSRRSEESEGGSVRPAFSPEPFSPER